MAEEYNTSSTDGNQNNPQQIKVDEEKEKKTVKQTNYLWVWLLGFVGLIIIYLVLRFTCLYRPDWILIVILADLALVLFLNTKIKLKEKAEWLVPLLMLVMPVVGAVYCYPASWWMWVISVVLFLLGSVVYYFGSLKRVIWLVGLIGLVLAGFVLYMVTICQCY